MRLSLGSTVLFGSKVSLAAVLIAPLLHAQAAPAGDWPSYNRTLDGQRYAPQKAITPANVASLREVCRYNLHLSTSFQTGPVVLGGAIYLTTGHDTIALDAETCAERWKVHEDYAPAIPNDVNRGAAVLDGRVFRGTQDGRVLAYDAATGKRLWEVTLGDKAKAETVPAALLAWKGLVFAGNAGTARIPVKGRVYALEAATGRIGWGQYTVPRSPGDPARGPAAPAPAAGGTAQEGGTAWTAFSLDESTGTLYAPGGNPTGTTDASYSVAYDAKTGAVRNAYGPVAHDFHDWEVSAAPVLITLHGGRRELVEAGKDGRIYAVDLRSGRALWQAAATTVTNASTPLTDAPVHFCPGTLGGNEWNGPAYSPATGMVYTGAVDWCSTMSPGVGNAKPRNQMDPPAEAMGWITAVDATTGHQAWRYHAPSPVIAGVTPTAGGVLFAGDLAGTVYGFDAKTGAIPWKADTGSSLAGGIVSYATKAGAQRIAVVAGTKSSAWPMAKGEAQVIVYGLP